MIKKLTILFCFACLSLNSFAQVVYENHRSEVYNFLYRLSMKGLIQFNDQVRPISRIYIEQCLDSVEAKSSQLSSIEKAELSFYKKEYTDAKMNGVEEANRFFTKDANGRWRAISIQTKNLMMRVDPVLTAGLQSRQVGAVRQYSSGFRLYGYAGKKWAFNFSFNDINETGTGIDTLRTGSSETGINGRIASNKQSVNFAELRASLSYSFKNGSISLGKDYLLLGYGENGRTILSDKTPTYPYLRLDYQPLSWLRFNYTHAWLNSTIIDSNRTYNTGVTPFGGRREFFLRKFMAQHSLTFMPIKGLDITVGESMVYSDRFDAGYLIPVLFFKAYDNLVSNGNINSGGNGQLFLQVSSRNHLKNTHLYGSLFVDEIRIATIFNATKSRNQLGLTLGATVTDIGLPYLTLGAEYTRINPFVYRNLTPAQDYTSQDYSLGDWMGNNADRWIVHAKYTPIPRLKINLRYQQIRKGGAGTYDQQYFQEPQPSFLFNLQSHQKEWFLQASYQWIPNLYLNASFSARQTTNMVSGAKTNNDLLHLGVAFGL
ncbi:capsule assembly Wzi family protein [Sediminibacterium sp.]|uniref:capsule assembly Wzi family protein n=1 Tax=Sediminibacterium sp. TaxID=1917865 RepID=UPI0027318D5A|nr:capsule assembly Wzi family protein [Sediminibacterium sp.]MDP2420261.1 capsule assembly Wzi family protein [Sediminibacterium sp.]